MNLIKAMNEQRSTFSADTFRPTESQKKVLLDMDRIAASGRTMKKADVVSSPNEQQAFDSLVQLELIAVDEEDKASVTDAGNVVIENIKKADPELSDEEVNTEEEPATMETFALLKSLNTITEGKMKELALKGEELVDSVYNSEDGGALRDAAGDDNEAMSILSRHTKDKKAIAAAMVYMHGGNLEDYLI